MNGPNSVNAAQPGDEGDGALVTTAFARRLFHVLLALAVLSAAISLAGQWFGRTIAMAGHTDSPAIHEIVIGNNVIAAPANMIRHEQARGSGVAARLDLYLRWPDMTGYSDAARDDFNHVDGRRRIVFLSFQERMVSRDMSGRFRPIYLGLIEAGGMEGPNGLTVHAFQHNSGYLDEVLAVGRLPGRQPFVARCLEPAQATRALAACERDLHVGDGLSLTYRFSEDLLGHWRELDAALLAKVDSLLVTGR